MLFVQYDPCLCFEPGDLGDHPFGNAGGHRGEGERFLQNGKGSQRHFLANCVGGKRERNYSGPSNGVSCGASGVDIEQGLLDARWPRARGDDSISSSSCTRRVVSLSFEKHDFEIILEKLRLEPKPKLDEGLLPF